MEKLKMQSHDVIGSNIQKIAQLFPNCVTERLGKDGKPELAIDFEKLQAELSNDILTEGEERYQFTWPDKRAAVRLANTPTTMTLRPCREESVDFDKTQNLYIEGDNLDVLKVLRETYLGKVKMIYIDPPYNTGNDFVYNDDFAQGKGEFEETSGLFDEEGNQIVDPMQRNTESNGRFHTDWLNMIYPRLKVARDLLTEDGVIFISIDDREADNLIKVCNEIFGEQCFIGNISWRKTYSPRNDSKGIPAEKECVIVYGKKQDWMPKKLPRTEDMDSKYKNPDNDIMPWTSDNPCAPGAKTHQGMVYAIQHPFTGELLYPATSSCWRYQQQDMFSHMSGWCEYELKELDDMEKRAEICGIDKSQVRQGVKAIVLKNSLEESKTAAEKVLKRGQWPKFYFTKNGQGGIRRKTYLEKVDGRMVTNLWPYSEVGHTDEAKKELKALFDGEIPFDTPKPVRLVQRMVQISTDGDDIVVDFFSGAASSAHSVMLQNAIDNGNRHFIMVQIPEPVDNKYGNLCEIGKERIRRAGKKIKEESPLTTQNLDTGFRVLKLDTSNMEDVYYTPQEFYLQSLFNENVKADRTSEDLLFQVMLDLGIELSAKIEAKQIAGKTVHFVDDNYLVACFDRDVNEATITEIAKLHPVYFVMRDASAANDNVIDNFEQIFKHYSPSTTCRVI